MLFLNDLDSFLLRGNDFGLNIFDDSLQCYFKLIVLRFADDMVLFAESIEELQDLLDKFHIYGSQWKLKVNHEKPKVVIFGDTPKQTSLIKFNQPLEVVDCLKYLGVVLQNQEVFINQKNMLLSRQGKHCLVYIEK